jgi:predicted dehydrogenase
VRRRIAAGELGHVFSVRTWGGSVRGAPEDPARYRRDVAAGGVLAHWTIHNIDLALWLLGEPEPQTATAVCHRRPHTGPAPTGSGGPGSLPVEDFGAALIRLSGGAVLTVEANWLQPPSRRPEGWEILGDRGSAAVSPLRVQTDGPTGWQDGTPPAGAVAPCDYDMGRLMAGFLDCVRRGGPAPVSGDAIVRIQRLMDALYESAATGREVALEVRPAGAASGGDAGRRRAVVAS